MGDILGPSIAEAEKYENAKMRNIQVAARTGTGGCRSALKD